MTRLSVSYAIEIKFSIKEFPNYGFGKDKNLYNLKTGKKIKRTINNRNIGYWLGKKFIGLRKLKTLLYINNNNYCPF